MFAVVVIGTGGVVGFDIGLDVGFAVWVVVRGRSSRCIGEEEGRGRYSERVVMGCMDHECSHFDRDCSRYGHAGSGSLAHHMYYGLDDADRVIGDRIVATDRVVVRVYMSPLLHARAR